MTIVSRSRVFLTASILTWLLGCGGATPVTNPKPSETPAAKTTAPEAPAPSTKTSSEAIKAESGSPTIEDDSAAAAIVRALQSLQAGNIAEAYDFLPVSYQSDVDALVHEFAEKIDPEVWSRLIGTARKAIEVLRTKKDMILALDLFRLHPNADSYRKHWDSTVQLLKTFATSDVTELPKLKKISARSLLPGKGSHSQEELDAFARVLAAHLTQQFAGVTVTPVRSEGQEQVIAIRGPNDEKPIEVVYVKHDKRWLPKSMVDHWNEGISANRDWLQKLPERIKTVKPQLLDACSQADAILDQLSAADNREKFEQAAGPAILSLATAWPNLQQLARRAVSGQSQLPHITILINRELTERELNKLTAVVLTPLRDLGSDYTLLVNSGRTLCRVSRISDIPTLRTSLATHFSIPDDDVRLDQETSTINVELAQ